MILYIPLEKSYFQISDFDTYCSVIYVIYNRNIINMYVLSYHLSIKIKFGVSVTRWTKQAFSCSKFLSPGGQLWANTAFEGSQFYSIGVPKFYSWVNVISVYAYNDLG